MTQQKRTAAEIMAEWEKDPTLEPTQPIRRPHRRTRPPRFDELGREIKRRTPARFTSQQVHEILTLHNAGYSDTSIRNFIRAEYPDLSHISTSSITQRIKNGPLKPKEQQIITREMLLEAERAQSAEKNI